MPLVVVCSPKGGVGKSTLTANLAVAMRQQNWRVVACDFDSQNALRYHLAPEHGDGDGIARAVCNGWSWLPLRIATRSGVELVPFGRCSPEERLRAKDLLTKDLLRAHFAELSGGSRTLIIVDTAPGDGRIQSNLEAIADIGLAVFLADAGSMALLPSYRDGLFLRAWEPGEPLRFGVLNQIDPRRRLSRDISEFIEERQSERFIGTVRYDEAIAEAVACGSTLMETVADEQGGAADIREIARRLNAVLS